MSAMVPPIESLFAAWWFWFMCLIGVIWLKRHLQINAGKREPILSDADAVTPADELPPLSMLVAGKEEEENIGRCLKGILAQDYPKLQAIAVNDRSEDRTGAIMDEIAAGDDRLTAVHVKTLTPGWFGKNHAMNEGLKHATADWFCFTDADCTFDSPKLLSAAVSFALRNNVEFLSVLPKIDAGSFWERVVQPVASAIMVYWNPPQKVNSPDSACAYANGAFMLMTRKAYDAMGGHEAVKATLNEDMHMARRAKQLRLAFRVIRGGDTYRVRMYTGLRAIWRGWSRIFYGSFGTIPRLIASFLLLSVASLSPYLTLVLSPLAGTNWWQLALAAGTAVLAQQSILWRFYRLSGIASPWALTYPLGTVLALGMTLNAMTKALGATSTNWRGTTYGQEAR
ncbi:MAG: glycosyltransferase [Phycisphaerae bacterium]|nr:glycosyltransferase [Phycisphaerae bacterium]